VGLLRVTAPSQSELYERASRAYARERYVGAAEYARSALTFEGPPELRVELLCLLGESQLRAGRPKDAAEAFQTVTRSFPGSPHEAQALFGAVQSLEAGGDAAAAAPLRKRLSAEFGETPWAARLAERAPGAERAPERAP
jgi:outer membrane protein assembly factor BamD (BamD/ComL family)